MNEPTIVVDRGQRGSLSIFVLALVMLAVFICMMLVARVSALTIRVRAMAAAEEAALTGLVKLHPPEYAPAGDYDAAAADRGADARMLAAMVATRNGVDPMLFERFGPDDVYLGATRVDVVVRPKWGGESPVRGSARGVPANAISEGRAWLDARDRVIGATGCAPFGIDAASLPQGRRNASDHFSVVLIGDQKQASFLRLSGSTADPADHLRFLGWLGGATVEGQPPPEVTVGDSVVRVETAPELVALMTDRLVGRVLLVPILEEDSVAGFARLMASAVSDDGSVVEFDLVPSAVARSARPGPVYLPHQPGRDESPQWGLVLAAVRGV